jgi:hypothetical protein
MHGPERGADPCTREGFNRVVRELPSVFNQINGR